VNGKVPGLRRAFGGDDVRSFLVHHLGAHNLHEAHESLLRVRDPRA
jgi:hypothetical protein